MFCSFGLYYRSRKPENRRQNSLLPAAVSLCYVPDFHNSVAVSLLRPVGHGSLSENSDGQKAPLGRSQCLHNREALSLLRLLQEEQFSYAG